MILPAQSIRKIKPILPFVERTIYNGMSYGLSHAGYDVRIAEGVKLPPGESRLASTIEEFFMPNDLVAFVHDKSTWARRGLSLFNTVIEPGWQGFLTLELVNHSGRLMQIEAGSPIAQIIFMRMEEPTEKPYSGKYQNQKRGPQEAIDECDAAHDAGELGKYKDGAIRVQIVDKDALRLITPEALAAFAVRNGWAHVGAYGQFGEVYEGQDRPLILLPCVLSIGDYAVRVSQGIVSFEAATGRDQLSIYAELTTHDECPNAGTGS